MTTFLIGIVCFGLGVVVGFLIAVVVAFYADDTWDRTYPFDPFRGD
jgi:hypothetical protein